MQKKIGLTLLCLLLGVLATGAYAAGPAAPDPMKAQFEMRKNIAWTVEGLYQLGKSKNRALKLTPAQAKKILPLYQELIAKKIVQLKLEKGPEERHGGPEPGRNGNLKAGPPAAPPVGNPRQHQARMKEKAALVTFGNAKMEAINRILTKKQVEFVDNWDFKAEKYGFPNFSNHAGGNHPGSGNHFGGDRKPGNKPPGGANLRRPDQGQRRAMDSKMAAGRKLLIKLYQDVLKMLQRMK
jgi:hypothetical protein